MTRELPEELLKAHMEIRELARRYGLDTFDIVFEMVDYDEINEIASLGGFPTRYPHWRFGMEYDYLNKSYTYGLQKIYELVINTDPCYAYLQTGNEIVDQKLVMAHVYGHCDFFKNNIWFSKTNRKMLDQMANHASRIRSIQDRYGVDMVEDFIDLCSSLDNLIDFYSVFVPKKVPKLHEGLSQKEEEDLPRVRGVTSRAQPEYMESYINPDKFIEEQGRREKEKEMKEGRFPREPERDILKFLLDFAPLKNWQHEILTIVRDEAYYFAPQGQTKIMNEGWASYWHSRIMTQHVLKDSEIIEFADHNAGVLATAPGQINPYKIGIELWRDIEDRWNRGAFGKEWEECDDTLAKDAWDKKLGQGMNKIFEVRRLHNDVTFIDEFLTEEFAQRMKLFVYGFNRRTGQYEIVDRDTRKVKNQLLQGLTNFGNPIIRIEDGNYNNRGELLLNHQHEGVDLEYDKAIETLKSLQALWQRPTHLITKYGGQPKLLSFDGKDFSEKDV